MLDPRESLGIALTVIYVPICLAISYLLFHKHRRPRMAWTTLFIFSLFRIASGILLALLPSNQTNIGIYIGALILTNVGMVPMLISTIGILRIICVLDFGETPKINLALEGCRTAFVAVAALLGAGGGFAGNYNDPSSVQIGHQLVQAGYGLSIGILAVLVGFEIFFWTRLDRLSRAGRILLVCVTAAVPFQAVRMAYPLLGTTQPLNPAWVVFETQGAFVGMVMIMELAVVGLALYGGYSIPRVDKKQIDAQARAAGPKEADEAGMAH